MKKLAHAALSVVVGAVVLVVPSVLLCLAVLGLGSLVAPGEPLGVRVGQGILWLVGIAATAPLVFMGLYAVGEPVRAVASDALGAVIIERRKQKQTPSEMQGAVSRTEDDQRAAVSEPSPRKP